MTPDRPNPPKSIVLVPLYMYPLPEVWEPLHDAISAHPDLQFTIIINPNSGPGQPPLPDASYSKEIPRLNARPNVQLVGYVRLDYCKRDLEKVRQDVSTYAGWSTASSDLAVQGIFFDESPNLFSPKVGAYLDDASQYVKDSLGIQGDRLVIHNPGTFPDVAFANPGPDVTAVLEETFAQYMQPTRQERLYSLLYGRDRCAFFVHSVPRDEVKPLVRQLRHLAKYVFVTELENHYYERFGLSWLDFIEAMQEE